MLSRLLDIIFPRRCLMCGAILADIEDALCLTCIMQAPVIRSQDFTEGELCRRFWHLMPIERAAAMFRYTPSSPWRALVTAGKFGGRHDTLLAMGRVMGEHFSHKGFFEGVSAIIPMPATKERVRQRGYNQAALLARGVSQATGLPTLEGVVERIGNGTKSQTTRNRQQRLTAIRGSFVLKRPSEVQGRHIVLIDDVCTTGASLMALGETLGKVPGIRLSVLTLMQASI